MKNYSIPDEELVSYQQQQQDDSDWVLKQINLVELLSMYGGVKIVGAKALGLMVARDIDISVIVSHADITIWQEIVSRLMVTKHVRKVTAVDEYNYNQQNIYDTENGKKYSLYIEMDTLLGPDQDKQNPWSVQIHLMTKEIFDESRLENVRSQLNKENTLSILRLKWWARNVNKKLLLESGGHFKIQSVWIYEAVLENGVDTIEGLLSYLKEKVRSQYLGLLDNIH